jgi:broad specificity phosphatase PhoE
MALIYLVRHGEAAAQWSEDLDPGLSDLGRRQAHDVGGRLRETGPLALVSSPLARARETALPLAGHWRTEAEISPAVAEIPSPPEAATDRQAWLTQVMGGTWADAGEAVLQWQLGIIEYLSALSGGTVIFSHFVAINAAVGAATDDPKMIVFRPDNCSVTTLDNANGGLALIERGAERTTVVR